MSASGLWVSTRCTRQKVKLVDKASLSYSTTSLPRNLFLYLNSAVNIKFHLRKFSQYLASLKTLHRGWNKALQALKWQCLHLPYGLSSMPGVSQCFWPEAPSICGLRSQQWVSAPHHLIEYRLCSQDPVLFSLFVIIFLLFYITPPPK